jgi:hypothetical protein
MSRIYVRISLSHGNAGRKILDGPGLKNVDLSIFRTFKIRERIQLQARGEFSNAFNLVNLSLQSTALATTANVAAATLTSPMFGHILSANDMRQVQVGLRLAF